jgi:hypothetical protein
MAKPDGMLHETGDRWQLDMLIPNRDRIPLGTQYDSTGQGVHSISKLTLASKPVVNVVKGIDPSLRSHSPVHTAKTTICEDQEALRRKYLGDKPLPGDRLL